MSTEAFFVIIVLVLIALFAFYLLEIAVRYVVGKIIYNINIKTRIDAPKEDEEKAK